MHFECFLLLSCHLSSVSHCDMSDIAVGWSCVLLSSVSQGDMSDFAGCLVVFAAQILWEGFYLLKAKGGECCYKEVGCLVQAYVLSLIMLFQAS